jgi:hypothetical protein
VAHKYVYSGAGGAATGADWANAYLTVKAAAEAAGTAAGDSIWVAHDHAETGAVALNITPKNTKAAPGTIACVDRGGSVPPVAADLRTTATVTTTGASFINLAGGADGPTFWHGITFSAGTGVVASQIFINTGSTVNNFKSCNFKKLGTGTATNAIALGGKNVLDNCTVQFGIVGDSITLAAGTAVGSRLEWINSPNALAGAIIPNTLFSPGYGAEALIHGVDLSAYTGTLVGVLTSTNARDIKFINCKLNAGVTVSAAQTAVSGGRVTLINCDSGAANYRNEHYRFGGNQFTETTIVRTGGASDGTTPISWKIVTDGNARWQIPFESLPITVWSDTTGAKTVSIYGYWDNASVPNNDDIWLEAEYLGSAGSPVSSIASSGKASFLAANAAIPSDTSTWGGGDTTTRFKMSASLTTAMKGPITVVVKAASASKTFYIDPKIEVA